MYDGALPVPVTVRWTSMHCLYWMRPPLATSAVRRLPL